MKVPDRYMPNLKCLEILMKDGGHISRRWAHDPTLHMTILEDIVRRDTGDGGIKAIISLHAPIMAMIAHAAMVLIPPF